MALDEARIALAHGNGGRYMRELIQEVFARHLGGGVLDTDLDACPLPALPAGEVVFTTDGFTVQPLEFPGGDIGSLAVHGTTNDLAVAGATPLYLSLNVFIEEGLEVGCWTGSSPAWRARRGRSACRWRPATPRSCHAAKAAACTSPPPALACGGPA
jgi:hypothetical protein